MPYGLVEVVALRPVIFDWAKGPDDGLPYGLITQEVREILPEMVDGDERDGSLSMNFDEVVPVLVSVIQEQQKEIDAQTERITGLEERLAAL